MKMKKLAAGLLAMIMAVSMTACGEKDNDERDNDRDDETSEVRDDRDDDADEDEDDDEDDALAQTVEVSAPISTTEAEAETTTTATTASAEPEVPVELPVLNVEPTLVMNGCMAFKCDGKNYVYNITENEMYETEYDVSDVDILKGCVAVFGDAYSGLTSDAYVVNLKTGEQYADVRPFFSYDYTGSYLTVGKLEESFSGNTVSIGMLNDKGEWMLPLSADYAVCKDNDIDKAEYVEQNDEVIVFHGSSKPNYDIANDKMIEDVEIWGVTDDKILTPEKIRSDNSDYMFWGGKICDYDVSSGEITPISDFAQRGSISITPTCVMDYEKRIFDKNYNPLAHDLSEYNFGRFGGQGVNGASEDVIVFNTEGENGNIYTVIQDKNGDFICEPFIYDKSNTGGYDAYFSQSKVICIYNNTKNKDDRIIDINTGEITEYDDSYDIIDYDDVNDLMLVNTNGAYYLVDPETPDTLINPFERAYN